MNDIYFLAEKAEVCDKIEYLTESYHLYTYKKDNFEQELLKRDVIFLKRITKEEYLIDKANKIMKIQRNYKE